MLFVDANGILISKPGLTSSIALNQAEADLSLAAMLRLSVRPLSGS